MNREHLKDLLEEYIPVDEDDSVCKYKFLSFVNSNEHCFDRFHEAGHVTASAFLVNMESSQALLMHHRKLSRWVQLGGHCEREDEDIVAAAIREAREESGIACIEAVRRNIFDIDIHLIPATAKEPAHYHYDVRFLLRATNPNEKIILNNESNQLRWIRAYDSEVPTTEPSVLRLFLKWKKFLASKGYSAP